MREEPDYNISKLKNEKVKYRVLFSVLSAICGELSDAEIPFNSNIESYTTGIIEVNETDTSKIDEILVKYD